MEKTLILQPLSEFDKKYPFIDQFVKSMENINGSEYVTGEETDLKSLLIFFKLYITTCRELKQQNILLCHDNISKLMKFHFKESMDTNTLHAMLELTMISSEIDMKKIENKNIL